MHVVEKCKYTLHEEDNDPSPTSSGRGGREGGDLLDAIGLGTSTYLVPHINLRPQHFRMSLLPLSLEAGNRKMMPALLRLARCSVAKI